MNFTKEQEMVIGAGNGNTLVSAAAGSGKTAVLVEHIIQRITGENPIDIDRILALTFTRAAAAQMKERILAAVEKKLAEEPENTHLQRQETLIHNAQITTIDSFCQSILRDHITETDLDPSFRVADEGELKILRGDVFDQVMEDMYAKEDSEFLFLVRCLMNGNSDKKVQELVFQLSNFADSLPNPEKWIQEHSSDYDWKNENLEDISWIREIVQYGEETVKECHRTLIRALAMCDEPDGPEAYRKTVESDLEAVEGLLEVHSYLEFYEKLQTLSFARLSTKKGDASPGKVEAVKAAREDVKTALNKGLKNTYFYKDQETIEAHMGLCARALHALCNLTLAYREAFKKEKLDKNIIDFSDMEHYALKILLNDNGEPTAAAQEYRDYFEEILVDEYQDSNLVQEELLAAIEKRPVSNRMMVGDIKQSIYRFRLARAEIFKDKMNRYAALEVGGRREAGQNARIDLHKNFRSRKTVLDSVNYLFQRIMGEDVGGVAYDEDAMLIAGNDTFPEMAPEDVATELLFFDKQDEKIDTDTADAALIAGRIQELMRDGRATEGEGKTRPLKYGDIVILLRSTSGHDDIYRKALEEKGIPAYVESKSGYFDAIEIQTLLNLLRILDNPLQDMPLVSVMHSSIGGFTDEELAILKAADMKLQRIHKEEEQEEEQRKNDQEEDQKEIEKSKKNHASYRKFYHVLTDYSQNMKQLEEKDAALCNQELSKKTTDFLKRLDDYRGKSVYLPVHELLRFILEDCGYLDEVTGAPGGERRRANVEMLLDKALMYEKTSFRGVFQFVRYMENLEKYEVDFGEANVLDEKADVIRIMSIHKSKGLEFPVVFLANTSKKFNMKDISKELLTDVDKGIGLQCIDPDKRLKYKSIRKSIIANKMKMDTLGEELRILYVALTRAKEKLIMTVPVDSFEKECEGYRTLGAEAEDAENPILPAGLRKSALSYHKMLLPALIHHPALYKAMEQKDMDCSDFQISAVGREQEGLFICKVYNREDLLSGDFRNDVSFEYRRSLLHEDVTELVNENNLATILQNRFRYQYAHPEYSGLYSKTTVTELKQRLVEEKEDAKRLYDDNRPRRVPDFVLTKGDKKGDQIPGNIRGTAYHRIMELLDLSLINDLEEKGTLASYAEENTLPSSSDDKASIKIIRNWIQDKEIQNLISAESGSMVNPEDVLIFLKSGVGQRLIQGLKEGKLHRESPFMMGVSADRLRKELPDTELLLVQGMVDVWLEEADGILLLDYKTDRQKEAEYYREHYKVQLDYYAEALERITGKKVKEKVIYSFTMQKEIIVS